MCTETYRDRHKNAGDTPWMWRGRHVYLKNERDKNIRIERQIQRDTSRNRLEQRWRHRGTHT